MEYNLRLNLFTLNLSYNASVVCSLHFVCFFSSYELYEENKRYFDRFYETQISASEKIVKRLFLRVT